MLVLIAPDRVVTVRSSRQRREDRLDQLQRTESRQLRTPPNELLGHVRRGRRVHQFEQNYLQLDGGVDEREGPFGHTSVRLRHVAMSE